MKVFKLVHIDLAKCGTLPGAGEPCCCWKWIANAFKYVGTVGRCYSERGLVSCGELFRIDCTALSVNFKT